MNKYDELISIRRLVDSEVPICTNKVLQLTKPKASYPLSEFFNDDTNPDTQDAFEEAFSNLLEFIAPTLKFGDCLLYGRGTVEWSMIAFDFIPAILAPFPRRFIPGTRLILIMLPDNLDNNYFRQCLDNPK